jgi:hypothetical protein
VVAAALVRAGASGVLLTDGDPQTLVNCLSNLALNSVSSPVCLLGSWQEAVQAVERGCASQPLVLACPLDWHERVPGLSAAADVIVASDVCYDPLAVPSLVALLQQLLLRPAADGGVGGSGGGTAGGGDATSPSAAYIATTKRAPSTLQLFLECCAVAGLQVTEVPTGPAAWPLAGAASASERTLPAVFQWLPALDGADARVRYVLHKVVAQ